MPEDLRRQLGKSSVDAQHHKDDEPPLIVQKFQAMAEAIKNGTYKPYVVSRSPVLMGEPTSGFWTREELQELLGPPQISEVKTVMRIPWMEKSSEAPAKEEVQICDVTVEQWLKLIEQTEYVFSLDVVIFNGVQRSFAEVRSSTQQDNTQIDESSVESQYPDDDISGEYNPPTPARCPVLVGGVGSVFSTPQELQDFLGPPEISELKAVTKTCSTSMADQLAEQGFTPNEEEVQVCDVTSGQLTKLKRETDCLWDSQCVWVSGERRILTTVKALRKLGEFPEK